MTYALIAVVALILTLSVILSIKAKHTLKRLSALEYDYLMLYIQKIDTLPAIIESLEQAGVSHEDL